jgi:hypothetical protein
MRRISVVLGVLLGLCMSATASYAQTVLTDVWKDKEYRGTANKIVVFWVVQDRARRILMEDEFVRQLKARGTVGMPGYVIIPPEKMVEREAALEKIRGLGADAVLVIRLIDRVTAITNIPEPAAREGSGPAAGSRFYEYLYDPPTVPEGEPVYLETVLFDVRTGQRVWAARSVTKVDPAVKGTVMDFIEGMMQRLAADRMIK